MKTNECERIADILVDYADGSCGADERLEVRGHLAGCDECRRLLGAIERSLEAAEAIWQDNLEYAGGARRRVRVWGLGGTIAAGVVLVCGVFAVMQYGGGREVTDAVTGGGVQVETLPTMAEIELAVEREGIAARLLAKAEQITQRPEAAPELRAYVEGEYRHIAETYPETLTARKIRRLIE